MACLGDEVTEQQPNEVQQPKKEPQHSGIWREHMRNRYFCCITPTDDDGPACTHGDVIKADHWSCCGNPIKSSSCQRPPSRFPIGALVQADERCQRLGILSDGALGI